MVIIENILDGNPIEIAINRDGSFEFLNYDIDTDIITWRPVNNDNGRSNK